jgi:hypothetical protein
MYVKDGMVDYDGIRKDSLFDEYLQFLSSSDPAAFVLKEDRLAFWINAYNAYTIRLIIDHMPLRSIRDIGLGLPFWLGPWSIDVASVGGERYTLNEIEHEIIRAQFRDARVHCALVCASRSCPKLREEAYEGYTLNAQLDEDVRRFLGDSVRNRFETETLFLSKIFDWYESDFEDFAGSLKAFIVRYGPPGARAVLQNADAHVEFLPYDWSLNTK